MGQLLYKGATYSLQELKSDPPEGYMFNFLHAWLSGEKVFHIQTSGSTGTPRSISVQREDMQSSAWRTIEYFSLGPGTKALLCLPPESVGGTMQLVRAVVGDWDLEVVDPDSTPMASVSRVPDFLTMVPVQFAETISNPEQKNILSRCGKILLGGAPVDARLEQQARSLPVPVYHGFGMTETLSHIAIRKLNQPDPEESYQLLEGVIAEADPLGRLQIKTGQGGMWIQTRDMVRFTSENRFVWLGREDFAIITGGKKVIPEALEHRISYTIRQLGLSGSFRVAGRPHPKWGEEVVLVTDGFITRKNWDRLINTLSENLQKHEIPRKAIQIDGFPLNDNGKLDRLYLRDQARLRTPYLP